MSMTDVRADLLQQIKDKAVVHGKLTLSSGLEADYYVDLRRITLDGEAAPLVGRVMLDLVSDLSFDAVGGLTLGADPVATSMLHAAAAARQPIAVFEMSERSRRTIIPILLTPLFVWLATPFMRPFLWRRLLWTYVVPAVPGGHTCGKLQ